jgi:hypothetical protein
VAADRALVERILAETGVERTPAPPQASYLAELSQAFWMSVAELIARTGRVLRLGPEAQAWIAAGLVALALAALGWMLYALLRRRRSRTATAETAASGSALAPATWDAAAWRAELERCLAEERIGDALRAAWWWLARSIAGPEVEPDWTSRDLLRRTRQREMRDLLRRLDVLTFGADRPGLTDVRHLAEQIRGALG